MSALFTSPGSPRCYFCTEIADVSCDVRIGYEGVCGRACCRRHSADTVIPGQHRCAGHQAAIGGEEPMRDGSRAEEARG